MDGIQITTDQWVFWQSDAWPTVKLNATIVFTWGIMGLLVGRLMAGDSPTLDRYKNSSVTECLGSARQGHARPDSRSQRP